MSKWIVTVTNKNQITIPQEIREFLGVGSGDKITFMMDSESVTVTRQRGVVQRTAGMMRSDVSYATAKEMRAAAEEAIAEDAFRRMNT